MITFVKMLKLFSVLQRLAVKKPKNIYPKVAAIEIRVSEKNASRDTLNFNERTPESITSTAHKKETQAQAHDKLKTYFQSGIGTIRSKLYTPLLRCDKMEKDVVIKEKNKMLSAVMPVAMRIGKSGDFIKFPKMITLPIGITIDHNNKKGLRLED